MIILLFILIVLAVFVYFLADNYYHDGIAFFSGAGAVLLGFVTLILICVAVDSFYNGLPAEKKIEMYEKENKKIEKDIDILVKQYMDYEGKTLNNFKKESSITLVNLYPDLKTNELVKKQIDIYTQNNNKIKELNEVKINMTIGKWLLYFGS